MHRNLACVIDKSSRGAKLERAFEELPKVICIDAGHGGTDPGAVNGRHKEAEAALGIANKIADKLKAKGHRVVLTRTKDQALLLQRRCDISNAAKADAFISIHCNSAENKDASGIETFKYPGVGGVTKRLAENIQNGLASNFPEEKDRGVKEAKYYVLKHTNAPAALVEVGFISHDPTAEKLFRFSYQDKLARVIAEGVEKTFSWEALQKYPEQSFAQKFSLCNR